MKLSLVLSTEESVSYETLSNKVISRSVCEGSAENVSVWLLILHTDLVANGKKHNYREAELQQFKTFILVELTIV